MIEELNHMVALMALDNSASWGGTDQERARTTKAVMDYREQVGDKIYQLALETYNNMLTKRQNNEL